MARDFALITNLLQAESYQILCDWLDFMPYPPRTLICFCGANRETEGLVRDLCEARGITLKLPPETLTEDIRKNDQPVIEWQFRNVEEPYCLRVALDTIPLQTGDFDWLSYCMDQMEAQDLLFTTGSTKIYRADKPTARDGFLLTQRVSLNFFLLRPQMWLELAERYTDRKPEFGRFFPEGMLERHCRENGLYGLRLDNRPDLRIFHVQIWDARIDAIRSAFRAGRGIEPFLKGYEDELPKLHAWQRYYMFPKPPLIRRLRIAIGEARRKMLGG
jgi:hypothetical protein